MHIITKMDSSDQPSKKIKTSDDKDEIIKRCIKSRIIEDCIYKLDIIIDKYLIDYNIPTDCNLSKETLSKINIANAKEESLITGIKKIFKKNTEIYPEEIHQIVNDSIIDIKKILN